MIRLRSLTQYLTEGPSLISLIETKRLQKNSTTQNYTMSYYIHILVDSSHPFFIPPKNVQHSSSLPETTMEMYAYINLEIGCQGQKAVDLFTDSLLWTRSLASATHTYFEGNFTYGWFQGSFLPTLPQQITNLDFTHFQKVQKRHTWQFPNF